jgi:hypothetical protein
MEVHHPKPIHGLRELGKEVAVIVLGVVIALAGEQTVEALHWRHKVHAAETAMRRELAADLEFAGEQQALGACAGRYIDLLQSAVAANRPDIVMRLYRLGPPTDPHPWRLDTWTAALNSQVPDRLSAERIGAWSLAFRFVQAERDQQWALTDLYGEAMAGRFARLDDAGVRNDQLKTIDRLRANEARRADITDGLLRRARADLGVVASADRATDFAKRVRACEAGVAAVAASGPVA